jgi:RNA polymerase sigma-70 factor (ECF subfamily)
MRDLLDLDSAEVSELLGITTGNQRVLLHRGRAAVRQALEDYVQDNDVQDNDVQDQDGRNQR